MNEKDMKEQEFSMPGVRGFSYEEGDRGTKYSKLYKETVPEAFRRPMEEHWLPEQEDLKLPE